MFLPFLQLLHCCHHQMEFELLAEKRPLHMSLQ
uniref:Uncharacterized protein n=1 Tax=Rhizophora mucronata TaxID=61149 RepID=A0A2P2QEE5_RHIMU